MESLEERIKQRFSYDSETGYITNLKTGKVYIESNTGKMGYINIIFEDKKYFVHRLAWLLYYGNWPKEQIDHINNCKSDNRIINLRECTNQQNMFNLGKRNNNTSGFRGVSYNKKRRKYQARIGINGVQKYLGQFLTAEEASFAYEKFAKGLHGDFYYNGQ